MATFAAALAVAILVAPAVQQILPSAYAATATGAAIPEGACSTGGFADDLLESVASSCGPNSSGSAAGKVAICTSEDGNIAMALDGGTCSIGY
jgi:hypothetical protein